MSGFLRGTGVALVTPFNKDGSIDYNGVTRLVVSCIESGIDYLVVLGTTAESVTLSKEEKKQLITHIIDVNNGQLPLVLGIGGNNTGAILDEIKEANLSDFAAILSVVPMYNKPTQEGIFEHYKMINDHSPIPVLLYNVPSRTGTNMTAETTLRLAQLDKIVGVKEAVGDFTQVLKIIKDRPEGFLVISGDDSLALPTVTAGGDGVISVVGQGFPSAFSEMIKLGLEGETSKAFSILYSLLPIIDYAFEEGNPAGIKSVLNVKGICKEYVRLPLVKASETLSSKIKDFIENYKVLI